MSMEKTVYITEKEREMCYKVIGAFEKQKVMDWNEKKQKL